MCRCVLNEKTLHKAKVKPNVPCIFANQKNIKTEILQEYHVPKVIEPLYNQEAINELVYEKIS